tara:strand:+ start:91 stop:354 length:264 start_codon:yes stop_codon:yes gene_type:complete
MKKLLGIVILGLLLSSNAYADEIPDYDDDINENIKKYGWKIDDTYFSNRPDAGTFVEMVTMSNKGWIIKCGIFYHHEKVIRVICNAP